MSKLTDVEEGMSKWIDDALRYRPGIDRAALLAAAKYHRNWSGPGKLGSASAICDAADIIHEYRALTDGRLALEDKP